MKGVSQGQPVKDSGRRGKGGTKELEKVHWQPLTCVDGGVGLIRVI